MAEKLSVQIALDGGAEIERQLANIGAAGQKAFADISKSAEQAGGFKELKPEDVTAKLQQMGVTGVDAIKKIQAAVQSAKGLETLVQGITSVETAFAVLGRALPIIGVAAVAAFTAAAKATLAFAETIQKASAEATKLGLTLEQFNKQVQGLEKLGLSTKAATEGLQQLGKATEQVKLDAVAKAIKELEEASARGFGAQGTAQLKILEDAARGVGEGAKLARAELEKLGLPIPTDVPKTLAELVASSGNAKAGMEAFVAQLRQMPDGLDRTSLAIANLGQKAGTELVQGLRLAEGSMSPVEAKAETLRQATERLSSEWGRFGSLTFSPAVVQGVDAATAALRGLDSVLTSMNWSAVGTAASVALNPLPNLLQLLGGAIVNLGSQFFGAGQAATQAGQQGAQGLQALTAAAGSAAAQMDQLGQKGAQAGQQAAQGLQLVANPLTGMPELINTTNQALAQTGTTGQTGMQQVATAAQTTNTTLSTFASTIAGITWDAISSAGVAAWNAITSAIQGAGTAITTFVSSLGSITWDAISSAGVAAWNAITSAIQGAIDKVLQFIGLKPSGPGTGGGAPGKARGGWIGGRGSGTSDSNLAWVSRGEYIMPAAAVRQPGVLSFLEALRRGGGFPRFADGGSVGGSSGALGGLINELGGAIGAVKQIWDGLLDGMQGVYQTLQKALMEVVTQSDQVVRRTVEQLQQLQIKLAVTLGHLVNALQGNARGGLLGGRGTGTSDSNLAWVSRGEHIMPARAVAQPGVLAFLEALRRSGGNLRGVLDGMGRFALGGMIPRPAMAFAGGGMVGGNLGTLTLGLPSGGSVTVRASAGVADELRREAALAQVRSGGRKPSRYS